MALVPQCQGGLDPFAIDNAPAAMTGKSTTATICGNSVSVPCCKLEILIQEVTAMVLPPPALGYDGIGAMSGLPATQLLLP